MHYLETQIGQDAGRFEYQPILGMDSVDTAAALEILGKDAAEENRRLGWIKYKIIESDKFPESPPSE